MRSRVGSDSARRDFKVADMIFISSGLSFSTDRLTSVVVFTVWLVTTKNARHLFLRVRRRRPSGQSRRYDFRCVLDACLAQDKHSRVACETLVKSNLVVVGGRNHDQGRFRLQQGRARGHPRDRLHNDDESFNADKVFMNALTAQSPDIAQGVDEKAPRARATPSRARATRA
jgi:hypothetical protein